MVIAVKEISIAHSPDSDDAFMFYGIASGNIKSDQLSVIQVTKNIQTLNQEALQAKYEVSAVSFAAYPHIAERYALMTTGASMGLNYGPKLIAKTPLTKDELKSKTIAIPGKMTSAYLCLSLWQPGLNVLEMPFDTIPEAVQRGDVDAGLIIHEGQLTYDRLGLVKIIDLGEWWYEKTRLPMPLGANVVKKELGSALMKEVGQLYQDSILWALNHRQEALKYASTYAATVPLEQVDKFVSMYVNELTINFGDDGRRAVELMFTAAAEAGIINPKLTPEFV